MKVGARTPWGNADHVLEIGEGAWFVSTPSHGGIKLDRKRNAKVHWAWRRTGGWYEEDVEWAIVAVTFPELYEPENHLHGIKIAKNWLPNEYMQVTGTVIPTEESFILRKEKFRGETEDEYVVRSASGHPAKGVPVGMVGCVARQEITREEIAVLVPAEEYAKRGEFGFVLNGSYKPWRTDG
jgi:hypothetical protein